MNTTKSPSQDKITLTRAGLLVGVLIGIGIFMRLYDLERMAYHHDESIHANYSYNMYRDGLQAWPYDPVYHGPFLYHVGALTFYLFGDSDFTGRLPFALAGVFMLWLIWHARRHIGTPQAVFVLALAVVSPVLTYFARFARNDVYMAAATLALLVFTLDYIKSRKIGHFLAVAASLVVLYCIKENSYVVGATFCGFLVCYGAWFVWSHPVGTRMRGCHTVVVGYNPLVKLLLFYFWYSAGVLLYVRILLSPHDWDTLAATHPDNVLGRGLINNTIDNWLSTHAWFPWTYWSVLFLLVIVSYAMLSAFRRVLEKRFDSDAGDDAEDGDFILAFCKRNLAFVGGMAVILMVFVALFTNFGTAHRGSVSSSSAALYDGVIDYVSYWMAQQSHKPRIANVPWYYLPRLWLYEYLPFFLSICAYVVYVGRGWGIPQMIGFPLVCWSGIRLVFRGLIEKLVTRGWITISIDPPPSFANMLLGSVIMFVIGMTLIAAGWFFGPTLRTWFGGEKESDEDPRTTQPFFIPNGTRVFLLCWAASMPVIYGLLNEKVPWLLTHQALPLVVLGGVFMGDLWVFMGRIPGRNILLAAFLVLACGGVRANCLLTFYSNDDAREMIVYTQSTSDIPKLVERIEDLAAQLGVEYMPDIGTKDIAAVQDKGSWPLSWYLRHYRKATWVAQPNPPLPPVVIVHSDEKAKVDRLAGGNYIVQKVRNRAWWPPYGRYWNPFHASNDSYFQGDDNHTRRWKAFIDYIKYRKTPARPDSYDLYVYIKKDLFPTAEDPRGPAMDVKKQQPAEIAARWGGATIFREPKGVALTQDGKNLLVVDSKNAEVKVLDGGGKVLRTFAGADAGPGRLTMSQFGGPSGGIDVGPDGNIYVTDTWGKPNRIVVYDSQFKFVRAWNEARTGDAFFGPRGLTVDSDGLVYITDTGYKRIVVIRPPGKFERIIGGPGAGPGQFIEPVGITFVPPNLLYVCDVGNQRIQVLDTKGSFQKEIRVPGWDPGADGGVPVWVEPYVAVRSDGLIVISDSKRNQLYQFDRNGGNVQNLARGLIHDPRGLVFGKDGMLYAAETGRNTVAAIRIK